MSCKKIILCCGYERRNEIFVIAVLISWPMITSYHICTFAKTYQLIQENISRHMNDKKTIRSSQHGFTKREVMLDQLIAHSEMVGLLDEGSVGTVYLDFRKAFDTVCHRILLDWQLLYGLGEQTVSWAESCSSGQTQMLMIGHHHHLAECW